MKQLISLLLCLALVGSLAALAFAQETEVLWDENHETILLENGGVYGEGEKTFSFGVDCLNETALITVNTDADTVGEALAALNIIAGEDSEWGLYVKTINGITADYNVDGSYWAFYIDGEYAMTGVDATEIDENALYLMKVEGKELEEDETITLADGKHYGFGEKEFAFQVVDAEGGTVTVTVSTDADTVGEALAALHIVAGEDSEWGLYVKTVSGITADYDVDGSYWAFYIDGEYAMTGVDATEIAEGVTYSFAIEK